VTVVVCRVLPLVAVTVMVWLPVEALRPTVMVMVELPAPVMEEGLKLTELPLPSPEALSEIGESNPPVAAVVMVTWPELLRATLTELGLALTAKPAVLLVTVRDTVVVSTVPPEVPLTVTVYVPGEVLEETVIDMLEEPAPVIEPGLKPMVTPEGCPLAERPTAESNPPVTLLVMVVDPWLP
jgi:hypothetical protein